MAGVNQRAVFTADQEHFRSAVRDFLRDDVLPDYPQWVRDGRPPRRFWEAAAARGILGIGVPEHYGGLPKSDFRHSVVVTEEIQALGMAIGGLRVQTDICLPYLLHYGTPEQCTTWLPRLTSGQSVVALGLSEPGAGSDLKSMSTRARRVGDHYVVNGAKTFISNGAAAELVILAVKTDPEAGRRGISLLLVDTSTPGFERGRKLDKLGLHAQDLAEMSFTDMEVPVTALLGAENEGFSYLTSNLAQERLSIAVNSQAAASASLAWTVQMLKDGGAGRSVSQDTKFILAQCSTEVAAGQALVDQCLAAHVDDRLTGRDAAMVKLYCTELQGRVVDRCLELWPPGAALRADSLIGNAYLDGRVSRIYGGSSEIMKVIIGQDFGL
ncbi:acyl-CoA dehydrogenase [Mycolicibacterium moriokaense]|uniref:Acyl-CoA dehydrogenase n=1 Tax=Mycolicibacterium moriokaense TaxID=39691 RepID=A0AAD1H752_9MYCO|nr:acyl-CoA dehydrogenase family protein [Mycolicibacterium moriokaense]MCV7039184.1 acyl-CoA dehydrogenase family protein [Mycolicibacterium moriokaense]ORB18534.1 acyl-CoA dehydrogenase [Mycolicibacterium moriokaense]BBX00088.1 acyl-CoA dehydrogenase [Mycolicibacterium moriokaense]